MVYEIFRTMLDYTALYTKNISRLMRLRNRQTAAKKINHQGKETDVVLTRQQYNCKAFLFFMISLLGGFLLRVLVSWRALEDVRIESPRHRVAMFHLLQMHFQGVVVHLRL